MELEFRTTTQLTWLLKKKIYDFYLCPTKNNIKFIFKKLKDKLLGY
jgi:hypothetical protein